MFDRCSPPSALAFIRKILTKTHKTPKEKAIEKCLCLLDWQNQRYAHLIHIIYAHVLLSFQRLAVDGKSVADQRMRWSVCLFGRLRFLEFVSLFRFRLTWAHIEEIKVEKARKRDAETAFSCLTDELTKFFFNRTIATGISQPVIVAADRDFGRGSAITTHSPNS